MKKIILIMFFATLAAGAVGAQGIRQMRSTLGRPDGSGRGRVEVVEAPDAAVAVAAADHAKSVGKISGYRVSLFRDNNQTAGENARSVASQFKERFPGIPVEVEYTSPYFKVTAGNYIDKVDAISLWGKALPHFKKAVVIQEEVSAADVVRLQRADSGEVEGEL